MAPDKGPRPLWRRPLVIVLLAVGLLLVIGAATPEGWAFIETRGPRRIVVPDPPAIFGYTLLVIVLAAAGVALWMRGRAIKEGAVVRPARRSPIAAFVMMALLLALYVTSPTLREWLSERLGGADQQAVEEIEPQAENAAEPPRREPSAAFGLAMTLLLFLLLVGGTALAVWLFKPDRSADGEVEDFRPHLIAEIERGIEDLDAISDPRAAVIACYARMEAVSEASGVMRRPSDTPFEHLAKMLAHHNVAEASARRLTELFEEAKFSDKEIGESTRAEAVAALQDVRAQIGALV